ncbi:MAG: dienelactone hydrolase family protein [Hyphomicrobiaceae bacterium]
MSMPLLIAENLEVRLPDLARKPLLGAAPMTRILHGISFSIRPGEAVGIVGESGSGKTTLGRALVRLIEPSAGRVLFDGRDIAHADETELRPLRKRMQMIFQNALTSLNPRRTVLESIMAPALATSSRREALRLAEQALERAGLSSEHGRRYPHQLSGGQRQRAGIARAIVNQPAFILADEIVSGLDVSTQAQILMLLRTLQKEMGLALAFIAHDLAVVRVLCERVVVMLQGRIVEEGPTAQIFDRPEHPYTRRLIDAIPLPEVDPGWLDRQTPSEAADVNPEQRPTIVSGTDLPHSKVARQPSRPAETKSGGRIVARTIDIEAGDGRTFTAYMAKPASGTGPGLVLLPDIFGINTTIRKLADTFAEEGYVVLVPDIFWRQQPGVELGYGETDRPRALALYQAFDMKSGVADLAQTIGTLRKRPEQAGKVGILGHTFGGTLAFLAAARTDVDCAVSYYGVDLDQYLGEARQVRCPMLVHIAGGDHHMPTEVQQRITDAFRARPDVEVYSYPGVDNAFATPGRDSFDRPAATMAMTRTLTLLKRVMGPVYDIAPVWEEHVATEFVTKNVDDTMETMVGDPWVNHIPTMTGAVGYEEQRRFYKYHFIPSNPEDTKIIPVSRTVGPDRIVDEMVFCFTHTREIDWMLPGIKPTGRYVEVPLVGIIQFRGDKVASEHIYWDQASVLTQIGLIDPTGLPIAGREQAKKLLDPTLPANTLMGAWKSSAGLPTDGSAPVPERPSIAAAPATAKGRTRAHTLSELTAGIADGSLRVIDLTQTLNARTPVIQLPPQFAQTSPFSMTEISHYDDRGPAWYWNNLALGEHTGTHFDAPIHWVTGKDHKNGATDTIPVKRFIAPAIVIDCSKEVAADEKFLLEVKHIWAFEEKHGRIPAGAWVLMRTEWSKRTDPARFLNAKEDGPHVPGPSADAVRFLINERDVNGFGVEAVGTDAGQAFAFEPAFPAHNLMHGANKFGLASLCNLDQLPATGAILVTAPLKIENGSGSPLRVLALVGA